MITCVYCDRELHHAPTKLGWIDKPGGFGLCFDCIQRCYDAMVAHRKAEAAAKSGAGEHISQQPHADVCPECRGKGRIDAIQDGVFQFECQCPTCKGQGKLNAENGTAA